MQAGTKGDKSRSSLRIGERHTSGIGRRKAEIAKAILPIDFCSHRRARATDVSRTKGRVCTCVKLESEKTLLGDVPRVKKESRSHWRADIDEEGLEAQANEIYDRIG